jgi:hypothetical protein
MATVFYLGIIPESNIGLRSWFLSEKTGRALYHQAMGIYMLLIVTFPFVVIYPGIKMIICLFRKKYVAAMGMALLIGNLIVAVWIQFFHSYTSV